jgi:cell division cycle 20-like protein 1 (cofactor of APC complex)
MQTPNEIFNNIQSPIKKKEKNFGLYSLFNTNSNNKLNDFLSPNNNNDYYSPFIKNSSNSSYKKISNFLTESKNFSKKNFTSNKFYSPSPNTNKTEKLSDRFIPMNKGINLMEKFNLANKYNNKNLIDENTNNSNFINKDSNNIYDEILKQNVLNENIFNNTKINYYNNNTNANNKIKTKIFKFKSNNIPKENFYYNILNNQKNNNNSFNDNLYNIRKINSKPYKILNAPNLMDDFYLNLVDWSSKNDIAVGLGNSVHLYTTNQTQENILFTYNNNSSINGSNNNIDKYVSSLIISQDGELLAVGNSEGFIEIYDINTQKIVTSFGGHESRIGVVAWNNNIISSGSKDCKILNRDYRCNNLNSNNIINKLCLHNQEVCGLKWSFDGTQLASGGNDNKLMIWNLHSNSPLMCANSHAAAVKAIAWSPHQHNILSSGGGTADRTIRFWNTSNFNMIDKIDTGSQVCNLVFSRTSNEIVSTHGFSLNQIIVWKYPSMNKIAILTGHTYRVLYLGLSPDGQNVVTGAGDETLRFWNLFPPYKEDSLSSLFPSNQDIR